MRIVVQLVLYCALFFALVKLEAKNDGWNCLYFYPADYQKEVFSRGLADEQETKKRSKRFMTFFLLTMTVVLIAIISFWNKAAGFWTAYWQLVLFLVVMNWFDGIVLDGLWVRKSKIWDKAQMAGFSYRKTWNQILSRRSAATLIYFVLALPLAELCVWLAGLQGVKL